MHNGDTFKKHIRMPHFYASHEMHVTLLSFNFLI